MSHLKDLQEVRDTFATHKTHDVKWRVTQLKQINKLIKENSEELAAALKTDLGWSKDNAEMLELSLIQSEAQYALDNIKEWIKPTPAVTPLFLKPAYTELIREPLGVVLIISPWNYPLQLAFNPLIAAVAAGNCAVIKPSEISAACSTAIAKLVPKYLDTSAFKVFEGGVPITTALLKERFDHIFYTGNTAIGKVISRAAAEHLTPVTLELGGKNPCIIDKSANLSVAAHRIIWGKFTNNGQTCLAPDYLIVHPEIEQKLVEKMKDVLVEFYGKDPKQSPDYSKVVSLNHLKRVRSLLDDDKSNYQLEVGGQVDDSVRYFAPTILRSVSPNAKVMQDEIFGPILPILDTKLFPASNFVDSIVQYVNSKPKSLAFYIFASNSKVENTLTSRISFGGGCVNDCLIHGVTPHTPFGGVGDSGQGAYHGKFGFDRLTHQKTIVHNVTLMDPSLRYPPYSSRKVYWLGFLKDLNPVKLLLPVGAVVVAILLSYFRGSIKKFL